MITCLYEQETMLRHLEQRIHTHCSRSSTRTNAIRDLCWELSSCLQSSIAIYSIFVAEMGPVTGNTSEERLSLHFTLWKHKMTALGSVRLRVTAWWSSTKSLWMTTEVSSGSSDRQVHKVSHPMDAVAPCMLPTFIPIFPDRTICT